MNRPVAREEKRRPRWNVLIARVCGDAAGVAKNTNPAQTSRAVSRNPAVGRPRKNCSGKRHPYQEESPVIASAAEFAGAIEHLQYAVFRRFQNLLTRAERTRLDNTIDNALFKIDRYLDRIDEAENFTVPDVNALRQSIREGREKAERLRSQAHRADLKLAQLTSLSPETFEEFVAELFEALGYEVEQVEDG